MVIDCLLYKYGHNFFLIFFLKKIIYDIYSRSLLQKI
jgi:hypothetical protein